MPRPQAGAVVAAQVKCISVRRQPHALKNTGRMKGSSFGPLDADSDAQLLTAYRYLLEAFPRLGRAPTLREMKNELDLSEDAIGEILGRLEACGALRLDPRTSWIADAYPYSPTPTSHLVSFDTGVRAYCMCAIDCFYVPFLTGSDISIESRCHLCRTGIHVRIERGKILMVVPVTTVVWDSEALYDCPKTNFFCSEGHLLEWRTSAPDEAGRIRSLDAALERGREAATRIRQVIGG